MNEIIAVYADGGVIGRNPSQVGGTWAWCQVGADGERGRCESGLLLPDRPDSRAPAPITNNVTEYYALGRALGALPHGWSGEVFSDSRITLGRIFEGWKRDGLPGHWHGALMEHVARLGELRWALLDGHPTKAQLAANRGKRGNPVSAHNAWCDAECRRKAQWFIAAQEIAEAGRG